MTYKWKLQLTTEELAKLYMICTLTKMYTKNEIIRKDAIESINLLDKAKIDWETKKK
jgi:hypothetical protein